MRDVLLSLRNISKVYSHKKNPVHALCSIDLDIYKGEVLGLLGPNGAGKTTLSSILATLHPPTSGDIVFEGKSIYDDLVAYRKVLGFCPQKPNLDPFLTVQENLIFAGLYNLMSKEDAKKRADELMTRFNLHRYASFDVANLSGGYKQRVLIARAMVHKPKLIILDEPTVGLDPDVRKDLWEIIKDLKKQGVSLILTTHYLDEAEELSDRLCFLGRGKIRLLETMAQLKASHGESSLEDIYLELAKDAEE
jgi:ABC-2 type transport system ATP-binding protein